MLRYGISLGVLRSESMLFVSVHKVEDGRFMSESDLARNFCIRIRAIAARRAPSFLTLLRRSTICRITEQFRVPFSSPC